AHVAAVVGTVIAAPDTDRQGASWGRRHEPVLATIASAEVPPAGSPGCLRLVASNATSPHLVAVSRGRRERDQRCSAVRLAVSCDAPRFTADTGKCSDVRVRRYPHSVDR